MNSDTEELSLSLSLVVSLWDMSGKTTLGSIRDVCGTSKRRALEMDSPPWVLWAPTESCIYFPCLALLFFPLFSFGSWSDQKLVASVQFSREHHFSRCPGRIRYRYPNCSSTGWSKERVTLLIIPLNSVNLQFMFKKKIVLVNKNIT